MEQDFYACPRVGFRCSETSCFAMEEVLLVKTFSKAMRFRKKALVLDKCNSDCNDGDFLLPRFFSTHTQRETSQ